MNTKKELTLKEIQNCELEILKHVHKFCIKNNIKYSLTGGSLLGAIRHNGFIPWDDDIDIVMLRDDYERFLSLYKNNRFVLYEPRIQKDYYYSYAKVIDSETEMIEDNLLPIKGYGVYLDIFPLDKINDNHIIAFLNINILKIIRKMHALSNYSVFPEHKKGLEKDIGKFLFNFCKYIGFKNFIKLENYIIKFFAKNNTQHVINMYSYYGIREIFKANYFKDLLYHDFNNIRVYILKEYHKFLSNLFGDYMQLPPREKRITHHRYKAYYK